MLVLNLAVTTYYFTPCVKQKMFLGSASNFRQQTISAREYASKTCLTFEFIS